jgi:tetratricopeptide (TPR) repeat protein
MTAMRKTLSLSGLFAIAVSGCSSPAMYSSEYSNLNTVKSEFIKTHEQNARKYESDGALNEAWREWKIIDAIRASETFPVRVEIVRLERMMALRVKDHLDAALMAEEKADYKTAETEFLKALALKPDNTQAVSKLKSMVSRRSYAKLALAPHVSDAIENGADVYLGPDVRSETDKGNSNSAAKTGSNPLPLPSGKSVYQNEQELEIKGETNNFQRGLTHLSRKEYKQALHYLLIAQKKSEKSQEIIDIYLLKTRQTLAKQHYDQGVTAFRAELYDEAVEEFEQALEYVPDHHKARFYHSSAKALQ